MKFFVIFLNVDRQTFEEICVNVKELRTTLVRTEHFFKSVDFIDHIMVQTRFTKIVFMLAIADKFFEAFLTHLFYLSLANLTKMDILNIVHS